MKKLLIILIFYFLIFLNYAWVHAEFYKWVDDQGSIHYSDKKPEDQQTEIIDIKPHTPDLTQFSNSDHSDPIGDKRTEKTNKKKQKVTMYSTSWCSYCKKARTFFNDNNISYSEYDIEKNANAKKRYESLGGTVVPLLVANKQQMEGFNVSQFKRWYEAL